MPTARVGPSRTRFGCNDETFGSRRAFAAILPGYPPPPSPQEALPARDSGPAVFSERGGEVAARDEVGKERRPCLVSGITPMGPMGRTSLRLLRTVLGLQAGGGGGARPDRGRAWGGAVGWGRGLWAVPEATGSPPPPAAASRAGRAIAGPRERAHEPLVLADATSSAGFPNLLPPLIPSPSGETPRDHVQ